MRVASINHQWWYDLPLSIFDPGSVERSKFVESQRYLMVQGVLVRFLQILGFFN